MMKPFAVSILLSIIISLLVSYGDNDDGFTGPDVPEREPEPTTGAVEVTTHTTGDDIDSDGYIGNQRTNINPSDTAILSDPSEDSVDVELIRPWEETRYLKEVVNLK